MGARPGRNARRAACLALVTMLGACGEPQADATASERGRILYMEGRSAHGDPATVSMTLLGDAARTQSAVRYACANCHGHDGVPRIEGGVAVPSIQPHALHAASVGDNGTGRKRPAYDRASLLRAITMGVDSGGNSLNVLMPRFNLSERDADDLLAWLTTLGSSAVPGVDDTTVRIAVPAGASPQHRAVVETVTAFAAETNRHGGIYGRTIEVVTLPDAAGKPVFGVVATMGSAGDALPATLPVFGAIHEETLFDPPSGNRVFQLLPSQASQLRVAVDDHCVTRSHGAATFHLVLERVQDEDRWQRVLGLQLARVPGATLRVIDPTGIAALPEDAVVLVAGSPAHKSAVLRTLAGRRIGAVYATHRFEPGTLEQLPAEFLAQLRLLLPIPIPAEDDPRLATFRDFLARHQLSETHIPQRIMALAACFAFGECLRRCGTRVTTERVVEEALKLYQYRPSLFPPITWTLEQRVGAIGAQVARFDGALRTLVPESDWKAPL